MKLALAVAGLAALTAPAFAEGLPDLGGREVTVVTENAYPPLQFIDGSGAAVGWEYDAMADIAKRLNMTVKYENTSWDAMIPAVSEGQYDIGMTGITIRGDRKEKVDFSDSYMTSQMVMMVRGDEARFTDPVSAAMVSRLDKVEVRAPIEALLPVFDRGHVAIVMDGGSFLGLITRIDLLNHLRRRVG